MSEPFHPPAAVAARLAAVDSRVRRWVLEQQLQARLAEGREGD